MHLARPRATWRERMARPASKPQAATRLTIAPPDRLPTPSGSPTGETCTASSTPVPARPRHWTVKCPLDSGHSSPPFCCWRSCPVSRSPKTTPPPAPSMARCSPADAANRWPEWPSCSAVGSSSARSTATPTAASQSPTSSPADGLGLGRTGTEAVVGAPSRTEGAGDHRPPRSRLPARPNETSRVWEQDFKKMPPHP